jgi:hypothetical protein
VPERGKSISSCKSLLFCVQNVVEQIWPAIVSAFAANLIGNIGGLDAQNGWKQGQTGRICTEAEANEGSPMID